MNRLLVIATLCFPSMILAMNDPSNIVPSRENIAEQYKIIHHHLCDLHLSINTRQNNLPENSRTTPDQKKCLEYDKQQIGKALNSLKSTSIYTSFLSEDDLNKLQKQRDVLYEKEWPISHH